VRLAFTGYGWILAETRENFTEKRRDGMVISSIFIYARKGSFL
jgi:hypothetical protein